jgi:predicted adenylyl cyclase CyaB
MATETEIKIRIREATEVAAILDRCKRLYGLSEELFQRDEYFDTTNELLKAKDFTVRLRMVNNHVRVALKGPRDFFDDGIHSRLELEFTAVSEDEIRHEIARHHLMATTVVEKRRWQFHGHDLHIAVDTLPFIGSFLEVEALTRERIVKVLNLLQVNHSDVVTENYTELLERKLSEVGLPIRPHLEATFALEAETRD